MKQSDGTETKTTLQLSEETHAKLASLKEEGHFEDMRDAYRLGIAVALKSGLIDDKGNRRSKTYLNIGSLDADGLLREVISTLFSPEEGDPTDIIERLAEAGVKAVWDTVNRDQGVTRLLATTESTAPNV